MPYERLIAGYVAHAEAVAHDQLDAHFWAYQDLHALVNEKPEAAWSAVLEVLARVGDEQTVNYVAADILEDLLREHADALLDRLQALARTDERFRQALGNVWCWPHMSTDVRARLFGLIRSPGEPDAV